MVSLHAAHPCEGLRDLELSLHFCWGRMVIGRQPVLEEGLERGEGWKLQTLDSDLWLRMEKLGRQKGGMGRKLFCAKDC